MRETNFKNWLFGISLHNPEILYSLYKALETRQSNAYFNASIQGDSIVLCENDKQQELLIGTPDVVSFILYLRENYCSGQNIEEWYKNKTAQTNRNTIAQTRTTEVNEKIRTKENNYSVHPKERIYATILLVITVLFWLVVALLIWQAGNAYFKKAILIIGLYIAIIMLAILLKKGILIGLLRGNAVLVTRNQFPEIYKAAEQITRKLDLSLPDIYIVESGGLLNAFATRFLGNSFLALYSDIVEAASTKGNKSLPFIIGHELAHIKRKHMLTKTILFPAYFIPFLGLAYSRACEYTCDKIAYVTSSPESAQHGLLLLAGGKYLYNQIDVKEYAKNYRVRSGFWTWIAEKFLTHPFLTKRLAMLFDV